MMERIKSKLRHAAACWQPLTDATGLFGGTSENARGQSAGAPAPSLPTAASASALAAAPAEAPSARGAGRIRVLTGVRALALLWVLAFHVAFLGAGRDLVFPADKSLPSAPPAAAAWLRSWAAQPVLNGDLGVDAFFTLSGVLIATMWLRETGARGGRFNYLRFAARRYLRLAPMLLVGVAAELLAGYAGGGWEAKRRACARDWWRILLMFNNYDATDSCLPQAWSVAVEFQLYLFAPLFLYAAWSPRAARPRRPAPLAAAAAWLLAPLLCLALALAAEGAAWEQWYVPFNRWGLSKLPLTYKAAFTRASPFVAGMAAALWLEAARQAARRRRAESAPKLRAGGSAGGGAGAGGAIKQQQQQPHHHPQQQQAAIAVSTGPAEPVPDAAVIVVDGATADKKHDKLAAAERHAAFAWRPHARAALVALADLAALVILAAFAFLGGGANRHTAALLGARFDAFVVVAGRPIFGAALAWAIAAMLSRRLRPLAAALAWPGWLPAAALSYSAYLLQGMPLDLLRPWTEAGVATLFAGWAVFLFEMAYFTLACLVLALPTYLFVEMPFQRIIKRGY